MKKSFFLLCFVILISVNLFSTPVPCDKKVENPIINVKNWAFDEMLNSLRNEKDTRLVKEFVETLNSIAETPKQKADIIQVLTLISCHQDYPVGVRYEAMKGIRVVLHKTRTDSYKKKIAKVKHHKIDIKAKKYNKEECKTAEYFKGKVSKKEDKRTQWHNGLTNSCNPKMSKKSFGKQKHHNPKSCVVYYKNCYVNTCKIPVKQNYCNCDEKKNCGLGYKKRKTDGCCGFEGCNCNKMNNCFDPFFYKKQMPVKEYYEFYNGCNSGIQRNYKKQHYCEGCH